MKLNKEATLADSLGSRKQLAYIDVWILRISVRYWAAMSITRPQ